jgi:hypothetical protein
MEDDTKRLILAAVVSIIVLIILFLNKNMHFLPF